MVAETLQGNDTQLKEEMDYWVKEFEQKISRTNDYGVQLAENTQNIEYNYELIKELQKEIVALKKEIQEVKHFNHIALKSRPLKEL